MDSLIFLMKKSDDTTEKVSFLTQICWKYRNFNPDTAVYYGEMAIKYSVGTKNIKDKINAYSYTGVAYRNQGIYSKALELYFKGAHLAEQNKEYELLSYAYINIANIHIYRNDYEKALLFLTKANNNSILVNNELQDSYICVNLGRVYTELHDLEKAHLFLDKSIDLRIKLKDEARIAVSYKYKGDLLVVEKKNIEALEYYHKALKIAEKYNDDQDLIADILHKISNIYYLENNLQESEKYAVKSMIISQAIGAKYRLKDAHYSLARIYAVTHNYKKAYDHYVVYADTKDSIFSKESNRLITNLQTDFAIEKQQKENEILRTRRAIDREIIKKQEIMAVSAVIGLLLMLVIVFILYTSNKEKKKANRILLQKNTEISLQKERIEQIAQELEHANKTKDRFFSILAHDLKNPFNTILGFSNLLATRLENFDNEKIAKMAKSINDTSYRTYVLLENLLEWSRSQTNSIQYNPEKMNLNLLVNENIHLLENQAKKKSVFLKNKLETPINLFADGNMTNTVFRNLISNAIKFTKQGEVSISAKNVENFCQICIEDTGIGISPQSQEKLFRIDKVLSTSGTDGEMGTGLGLILCKEFIIKHKGEIWVESQVGKGSRFCFTLPLFFEEKK